MSTENSHLNQLMKELKISNRTKATSSDRALLSKWWTDFFDTTNVDVSQFDFRDGLNNHTEIHICVEKFVTLTAMLRSGETAPNGSMKSKDQIHQILCKQLKIQKLFEVKALYFVSLIKQKLDKLHKKQADSPQTKLSEVYVKNNLLH